MSSTNAEDPKSEKNSSDTNSQKSTNSVKQQLTNYGSQVQEYLEKVDAKIDGFKFSLEKHNEELTFDLSFRATFHPRNAKTAEKAV